MKTFIAVALIVSFVGQAMASGIDVASFTPRQFSRAIAKTGWIPLDNSNSSSSWYSYWLDGQMGTVVILKTADKAIGDGYTTIKLFSGFADCRGASQGKYPTHLMNVAVEVDDAATGFPPPGYSDVPMIGNIALVRGTVIAEAVKRSCDASVSR